VSPSPQPVKEDKPPSSAEDAGEAKEGEEGKSTLDKITEKVGEVAEKVAGIVV